MEKIVKEFASMYGKALIACGNQAADVKITAFTKRLEQMCASDIFKQHNVYPSMGVDRIYAVIAVCLELKDDGMSDPEIIEFVNQMFESRRKPLRVLLKGIDLLPDCYQIAKKWRSLPSEIFSGDGVRIGYILFPVWPAERRIVGATIWTGIGKVRDIELRPAAWRSRA